MANIIEAIVLSLPQIRRGSTRYKREFRLVFRIYEAD
jgi:hypothetical protein